MERIPVNSSKIANVGYDEFCHLLEVEFHSGAVWQYFPVGPVTYRDMMAADSIGSFHYHNVQKICQGRKVGDRAENDIAASVPVHQFGMQEFMRIGRVLGIDDPDELQAWINNRYEEIMSEERALPVAAPPKGSDQLQQEIEAARERVLDQSFDISFAVFNVQGKR